MFDTLNFEYIYVFGGVVLDFGVDQNLIKIQQSKYNQNWT